MRSRWFHRPLLHTGHSGIEKKASWLELFYDLIFVAAFIQLGNSLADKVSVSRFLSFAGIFVTLWWAWTGFTFYINRFTVDDFLHRNIVLLQMFAVGAMGITAPAAIDGDSTLFVISYASAQLLIGLLYFRAYLQEEQSKQYSVYWGSVFALGGVVWLISIWVPAPYKYFVWGLGVIGVLVSPFSAASRALAERYPLDWEHLAERYALLTIIVLGESFVKVVLGFYGKEVEVFTLVQAIAILLITTTIWWIYFDDVAGSEIIEKNLSPFIWLYSHLFLQIGITAMGVSLKKAAFLDLMVSAPAKYGWLISTSLALVFISTGIIDSVTYRKQAELGDRARVNARLFSGAMILFLAAVSHTMTAGMFLGIVAAICIGQVVFDMMMAPLEESMIEFEHQKAALAKKEQTATPEEKAARSKLRPKIGEAIRKGTPSSLRKDVYFFFMEGSWTKVFISITFFYFVLNVFFAILYMIEPGAIDNANSQSFLDAFFFSVQTMSTIGYGSMSPGTMYGDLIVTLEAAVGILGVALVTGLMFAKVSRPSAQVLFSDSVIITTINGKKTLAFRAGNARGNDIVDASVNVTALVDTYTREGQHIRKIHELKVVRSKTPFFTLSWLVMHEIDKTSPLYGIDWQDPGSNVLGIMALIIGHDGTYGSTVYDRKTYYPEDIKVNHHYVDVIETMPNGTLVIDYEKFHLTVPDEKVSKKTKGTNRKKSKGK